MSTLPEHEFDLEKLFLPAWATEPSKPTVSSRAREETGEGERKGTRGGRGRGRAAGPKGPAGRAGAPAGSRPAASAARPAPTSAGAGATPARPARPPLPELEVRLVPDPKGVDQVARRIRSTGRAFPLFDIARLFLEKPERYSVEISVKKKPDGTVRQSLYVCALDETPWLSVDEVVAHVLQKYFDTFYQAERTPTEPPKGKYTFVAQCGYSGVILGPPNHHDYPQRLRQLHAERFSHIPFETYKARVKIVRDEAVVKQWLEEQSWKTEYVCLNVPEPLRLGSREAVERHFREVHAPNIVREVDLVTLSGQAAQQIPCRPLARLVRHTLEEQKRFPLQIATALSQQFAAHGLQFFKVNRTITHVAVARPHYLDIENTPVSINVKRIVQYILEHPHCTRRQLIEALAPSPQPAQPAAASESAAGGSSEGSATGQAPEGTQATSQTASPLPTPEQTQLIADLHWLIHQGHVIEFSSGALEVAKKPAPKPAKPAAQPAKEQQAGPTADSGTAESAGEAGSVPAAETTGAGPGSAGPVGAVSGSDLPERARPAATVEETSDTPKTSGSPVTSEQAAVSGGAGAEPGSTGPAEIAGAGSVEVQRGPGDAPTGEQARVTPSEADAHKAAEDGIVPSEAGGAVAAVIDPAGSGSQQQETTPQGATECQPSRPTEPKPQG
ncbi:hypothetical protein G4L39_02255 [Limisphaera ngatamarikiensis]|uniref:Uncharacterized protein n=1 Tax=Limisphaera ngatamarikiensis TaxID=1324935 RepID=A0A6M1RKV0_9BACT|nr:hypothetical protein [Limisphaera ngatamarikiensis]NGO38219.1 hypothetical protein [Limisphaera ngatamarikiensis]